MAELITWCTSRLAILKWLQILCAAVAVLFLIDGRFLWKAYSFIFVACIVLGALSFITLALYFFRVHLSNKQLPWVQIEIGFNAVAGVLCLICTGVLIFDAVKFGNNDTSHHRYRVPDNITHRGWLYRILIVLITQICNTLFYLASFFRTKRYGIK